MRLVLLLMLAFLLPISLRAHVLGEVFEETHLGKPGPRNKIVPSKENAEGQTKFYMVTQSSVYGSVLFSVSVSAETGKILSVGERVPSIHEAVLRAIFYCEGEVQMPQKATWPNGFELVNFPGEDQKDKVFQFTINSSSDGQFMLKSVWMNPPLSKRSEAVAQRLEELRKQRNDYFQKNGN